MDLTEHSQGHNVAAIILNFPHSIGFRGGVRHRSAEASGREDLVAWGRARCSHEPVSPPPRRNRACDFHRTRLPRDWRLPLPALPLGLSGSSRSLPPPPSYGTMDCPEIHQGQDSYWTSTTSLPWRPSPRTQLSRAPSVESKVVGRGSPPTVRSIKRLVQFSRKPLSSAAPP